MTPDLLNITYVTIRSWRSQFGKAKCNEPILNNLPVLDISALPSEKTRALADTYDMLSLDTILPFPNLAHDATRHRIDEAIVEALGFPNISILRNLLSHELIVWTSKLPIE